LTIIDRYILKSFLFSFVVCFGALFGLFVIVDIFDHIKELIDLGFYQMFHFLVKMYIYKVFYVFKLLGGPVTLMAAMFTMTRLRKNNELVPLKACGISVYRILMPIFMMGILVTLLGYLNEEVIIPSIADKLLRFDKVMKGKNVDVRKAVEVWDGTGKIFYCGRYMVKTRSGEDLIVDWTLDDGTRVQIIADKCVWKPDADNVDKWFISNVIINKSSREGEFLPGYPVRYGKDGMVIEKPGAGRTDAPPRDDVYSRDDGKSVMVSDVTPDDFAREEAFKYMSAAQIRRSISDLPSAAKPEALVRYHAHFSAPLASIVLLILGLPFVLRQESANVFLGVGVCIIVCAGYIFVDMVSNELGGSNVLSPAAAAWFPVLVFGPVGVFVFDSLVRT